jgi:hypothetical protein
MLVGRPRGGPCGIAVNCVLSNNELQRTPAQAMEPRR